MPDPKDRGMGPGPGELPEGLTKGETQVMGDGEVGGDSLHGVDSENPEGSAGLGNEDLERQKRRGIDESERGS